MSPSAIAQDKLATEVNSYPLLVTKTISHEKNILLPPASSLSFAQVDSTDIIIKQMMEQQKIVGLSLAVIKNGKPIVNKGYGFADVELNVLAS